MLFDPLTFALVAVLDWEWVHVRDPVEDLAWCEWIIRMHHPDDVPDRQAAMQAKCDEMLTMPRPAGSSASGVRRWRRNIEITLESTD